MPTKAKDLFTVSDLETASTHALIMGPPKVGKTTTIIATCEAPTYVITGNADKESLYGALAMAGDTFEMDYADTWNTVLECIETAETGVKEGKYKTIVVDDFQYIADKIEAACLAKSNTGNGPDGRRAYPVYHDRLEHIIDSLFALNCHVFF